MSSLLKFFAEPKFNRVDSVWMVFGSVVAQYSTVAAAVIFSVGVSVSIYLEHRLSNADAGS